MPSGSRAFLAELKKHDSRWWSRVSSRSVPGWFVLNAGQAAWVDNTQSHGACIFESDKFWRVYQRSGVALRYGASVETAWHGRGA